MARRWANFIINKSTDGYFFTLCKLSSSTFSCQTVNIVTNEILLTFLGTQSNNENINELLILLN